MEALVDLITNPFLMTGVAAWFLAQVIKTVLHAIINRKLDMTRLFGDGGMPSGHSATVTSMATIIGLVYGFGSVAFAISGILAIIVCHDATGVRLETQKQGYAHPGSGGYYSWSDHRFWRMADLVLSNPGGEVL